MGWGCGSIYRTSSYSSDFEFFFFLLQMDFSFIGKAQFRRATLSCDSSYCHIRFNIIVLASFLNFRWQSFTIVTVSYLSWHGKIARHLKHIETNPSQPALIVKFSKPSGILGERGDIQSPPSHGLVGIDTPSQQCLLYKIVFRWRFVILKCSAVQKQAQKCENVPAMFHGPKWRGALKRAGRKKELRLFGHVFHVHQGVDLLSLVVVDVKLLRLLSAHAVNVLKFGTPKKERKP